MSWVRSTQAASIVQSISCERPSSLFRPRNAVSWHRTIRQKRSKGNFTTFFGDSWPHRVLTPWESEAIERICTHHHSNVFLALPSLWLMPSPPPRDVVSQPAWLTILHSTLANLSPSLPFFLQKRPYFTPCLLAKEVTGDRPARLGSIKSEDIGLNAEDQDAWILPVQRSLWPLRIFGIRYS